MVPLATLLTNGHRQIFIWTVWPSDNDLVSTFPWFHLPDRMKLGLQRLRLGALESLQNLRVFQYMGSTLSQGSTQAPVRPPSSEVS
jgi:hypothetical protein